ncbi:MAG TPA: hypothetical protein DEF13_00990 [Holosporales bacterium]|nr:hypothetical protein [Holosporales bacterium]
MLDRNSYEHDLKDFSFTFLELPKFQKSIAELSTISDKWMYFFKNAEETTESDLEKLVGKDMIIERAYDELDRFHWNEEELLTYDQAEKYEGAYIASMAQKYDEGLEKGLEKGREEGIEKVARNMLSKGIDVEIIASVTGLTPQAIRQLH